jgi:hypothetical protein
MGGIFKAMPTILRDENGRTFAYGKAHIIKNQISAALNDVEGLVLIEVSMNRDTYPNRDLLSSGS